MNLRVSWALCGAFLGFGLFTVGCANRQRVEGEQFFEQHAQAMNFGPMPTEEQAMALARNAFELTLKDAESARYRFSKIVRGYVGSYGKTSYGWVAIVLVNAKNSYGAYAGYEERYVFIVGERGFDITEELRNRRAGII